MIRELAKRVIPSSLRPALRSAVTRARHAGLRNRCNICGAWLARFLDHGTPPESEFLCPVCGSKPPHRLAQRYFDQHPELFVAQGFLLHIAPEPGLKRRLSARARERGMTYRAGALNGSGDSYLDILDLPFEDGSVSLMYCCHVLNMLEDDRAGMREVRRVLHPEGVALLQVPAFHQGATTLEARSPEERLAAFSDVDMYRMYTSEDYERRLRECGFEVTAFRAGQVPPNEVRRNQLKNEILHVCRIPGSGNA